MSSLHAHADDGYILHRAGAQPAVYPSRAMDPASGEPLALAGVRRMG